MNVKIITYEPIHALDILERNVRENDVRLSRYPNWEETVQGWKLNGPAFTMIAGGVVVGCAGVVLMEGQKGEAWTLLSSLFYKYPKTAFKTIRDYLDKITRDHKLRRIQAFVDPVMGFKVCDNFLKHLGFKLETPEGLESFGPTGQTLFLYGKLYECKPSRL